MIYRVEQFKYLSSIKGVVPVHNTDDLSIFAVSVDCFINVLHGFFVNIINDDFDFLFWNIFIINILVNKVAGIIMGIVIYVDDMIVLVVLHED